MTDKFNEIMLSAIKICEGQIIETKSFSREFSKIYPFTTENITGYIDLFELKNKSLLTVGSSLDQALNAILYDCKDITVLDINEHIKYYYFLKSAAILSLTRTEFLEYLRFKDYPKVYKDNKNVFNINSYNKLKETLRLLDYESYLYWDKLFQTNLPRKVRTTLFKLDEDRTPVIIGCNPYLQSEAAYQQLRTKITKTRPKFITTDIFEEKLSRNYDNIWLSTICTWIKKENQSAIKNLVDKINQNLTPNGRLLISYLYDTTREHKYQDDWQPICDIERGYELLKDYQLSLKQFPGVERIRFKNEIKQNDAVLVYQKK